MNNKDAKGILYGKVSDFAEKIAPIYKQFGWKWGDNGVPTQADIENCLKELIDGFSGEGASGAGGLIVHHCKEEQSIGISFEYEDTTFY